MSDAVSPRLAPGVRLVDDPARGRLLLGPERMVRLDPIAAAIVERCDGRATLDEIVTALAVQYEGDRGAIDADVRELLTALAEKGLVRL